MANKNISDQLSWFLIDLKNIPFSDFFKVKFEKQLWVFEQVKNNFLTLNNFLETSLDPRMLTFLTSQLVALLPAIGALSIISIIVSLTTQIFMQDINLHALE